MIPIEKRSNERQTFHIDDKIKTNLVGRLTSYTRQLTVTEKISALGFFNHAKSIGSNRSFWGEPQASFYIVGVGVAYEISATNNRFHTTETKWSNIKSESIIFNEFSQAGTGLVALGGMSFDPQRDTENMWQLFPNSQLIVPKVMLTIDQDQQFLTTNVFIEEEHLNKSLKAIHEQGANFLQKPCINDEANSQVVKKEEQAVAEWKQSVQQAIDEINNERAEKIVLARELRVSLNGAPHIGSILEGLLKTQPTSYIFAIERDENCFVGATPERLVRVTGEDVLSTCLAGTAPRGKTADEDEQKRDGLFNDTKNRLEHDHVVQMINEAISPYCNNVNIPQTPTVKTLKNLHHLYTPVTATLKEGRSIFNIVKALYPTPALGGVSRDNALP